MTHSDNVDRARVLEAFETIHSLDHHGDLVRLILSEAWMLAAKYRNVRRHDVPHVRELSGLLDVLWQEVEMTRAEGIDRPPPVENLPLFGGRVPQAASPA